MNKQILDAINERAPAVGFTNYERRMAEWMLSEAKAFVIHPELTEATVSVTDTAAESDTLVVGKYRAVRTMDMQEKDFGLFTLVQGQYVATLFIEGTQESLCKVHGDVPDIVAHLIGHAMAKWVAAKLPEALDEYNSLVRLGNIPGVEKDAPETSIS